MVISRPVGASDVGYRMVARPLLERLDAVRGEVDLVVLRPPTLDALQQTLAQTRAAGEPFQVVHFDGHGVLPGRQAGSAGPGAGGRPVMLSAGGREGVLVFERPGGGRDDVPAAKIAAVLRDGQVPVVVLNACQSGAVGKDLEAAVATRLLREGAAAVVAMGYSVYAVAAAEFMAVFYERLFAGDTVSAAVTAGRRRLFTRDLRPSPKGELPLADWLVPVHYLRRDVAFPQARPGRATGGPSLETILDQLRDPRAQREDQAQAGNLDPAGVFVGRDDFFWQLEAAARLQHVVVLHGLGGTGKTELAKAFGRWWRDTGGAEQVVWHSFEPGVASFGLDGVITQAGLQLFGAQFALLGPDRRRQAVERALAQHRVLLIWDNFETVASMPDPDAATPPLDDAERQAVREFLAEVARGRSVVIITSRAPEDWLGGIRRIPVGGLVSEEAAEYADAVLAPYPAAAGQRAGRAFGELMAWLDGHPLSIRLTLPQLDATSPQVLLEGLRGTTPPPGQDLRGQDPGGGRGSSLAACVTYSHAHLGKDTRRLLPAVCLFEGVADADVLAAFSGADGVSGRFHGATREAWASALDQAANVGLVARLGGGMYRIHPALPAYLAALWRQEDPAGYEGQRAAATRALLEAYADFAGWLDQQISSGDAALAYTVIGLQQRTMGNLLGYALDGRHWSEAEAIADPLNEYWKAQGRYPEADAWTDRVRLATEDAAGAAPALDSPAGSLWLFFSTAQATRQLYSGQLAKGEATHREILAMLEAQPDSLFRQDQLAVRYHLIGSAAQQRGRLEEAADWYTRSAALNEELGNQPRLAMCYHQLGSVAYLRGRLGEAEEWCRQSLAIKEELGDRPGMAGTYHQLGMVAQERGGLDQAEEWYRKSLAIHEALGNRPSMARTYHQLGIVAHLRGRLGEAEEWYRKSLAISEDLGDRPGMAGTYHELGLVAQGRERLDQADEWYRKSLAIHEALGDQPGVASTYHQLGNVSYLRGRLDEAEEWYRRSLAIKEDLGNRPGMAGTYHQLSLLAEARGQPQKALEWTIKRVVLFDEFPHPSAGPGHLAWLAAQLGTGALEECWRQVTGGPLPQAVRDYVAARPDPGSKQEGDRR